MNYFVSVFTCILSTSLCGMQKVAHSETLMPGGKSVITSYLHILPKDVEELVAQLLIHAHPALFPPVSCVLSGHSKVSGFVKTKNSQNFGVIFRSCSPPASFGRLAT